MSTPQHGRRGSISLGEPFHDTRQQQVEVAPPQIISLYQDKEQKGAAVEASNGAAPLWGLFYGHMTRWSRLM